MELIKENKEKNRATYRKDQHTIRKVWYDKSLEWVDNHGYTVDKVKPNYVIKIGAEDDHAWIDFIYVEGIPASEYPHTPQFVKLITEFCVDSIRKTSPYAHGDWVLSNIIINDKNIELIDWDNVGIYPVEQIYEKLRSDLKSAFGDKFDTSSI